MALLGYGIVMMSVMLVLLIHITILLVLMVLLVQSAIVAVLPVYNIPLLGQLQHAAALL